MRSLFLLAAMLLPPLAFATTGFAADAPGVSDPWRHTVEMFNEWAAVQRRYTPEQIAEMRRTIENKVAQLSPQEAAKLRAEIDAKLHILLSAEARDARQWLAATLAVASDSYAKKIEAQLPDVMKASPAELADSLQTFEARQGNLLQFRQGVDEGRKMAVKGADEYARRQVEAAASARAAASAPAPAAPAPAYAPPASRVQPRYSSPYGPTLPYFPNAPYAFPYGYGGIWW